MTSKKVKKRTFKVTPEQREATTPYNVSLRALGIERDEVNPKDVLRSVKDHKYAPKYKEDEHIQLLVEVFNNGEGVEAFCMDALIAEPTFYQWIKTHENFGKAYQIALKIGARKWMRYPVIKSDINFLYWKVVASSRYGMNKIPVPSLQDKVAEKTAAGRINIVWETLLQDAITKGEISDEGIQRLITTALAQSTIENKSEVPTDNAVIRKTREEVLEEVKEYNKYIEHREKEAVVEEKKKFVPGV